MLTFTGGKQSRSKYLNEEAVPKGQPLFYSTGLITLWLDPAKKRADDGK
jgi:hypothetical protein